MATTRRRAAWCGSVLAGAVLALTIGVTAAHAQEAAALPDEALRKDIAKLLDLTGATRMGAEMASMVSGQLLDAMSKQGNAAPKAVEVAKQVLNEEFKKAFEAPNGLTAEIVSVYAKHFTREDIKGLLEFYETPVGRKMISVMPALFQESAAAGQEWAQRNLPGILGAVEAKLKAEGFIK